MARTYHIFDVVIIGAGTAGIAALSEVLKHTTNVVLVERGPGGTTCARSACMPSKTLIHASRLYHARHKFREIGIEGGAHLQINIPKVLRRVRKMRDHFVAGVKEDLTSVRHYIVDGEAQFESPTCLRVDGKLYHTRCTIIATGSTPVIPPEFAGIPASHVITSDILFERKDLPQKLGIVGLGPLGLEMAQALMQLGIKVVAAHDGPTLGGIGNPEISAEIAQLLGKHMTLYTESHATARMDGDMVVLNVSGKMGDKSHRVDALLISTGRKPQLEPLGLRRLKVPITDYGTPEHDPVTLQLRDHPIFLAGDVTDERAVLHEVALEGKIAAQNAIQFLYGKKNAEKYSRYVPMHLVFTDPNIASVGMTWEKAQECNAGLSESSFANQGRAMIEQRNAGKIQLFFSPKDGTLLGAELLAPAGEHLAHLLALAIQQGMTRSDMLRMPFYHPTFEEGLRTALQA